MNINEWLRDQEQQYTIQYEEQQGENHFVAKTLLLSDEQDKGLPIKMSLNDQGQVSVIHYIGPFEFRRLNIAEGFSSEFLTGVAEHTFRGELTAERGRLGIPYLPITEGRLTAIGKIGLFKYLTSRSELGPIIHGVVQYGQK